MTRPGKRRRERERHHDHAHRRDHREPVHVHRVPRRRHPGAPLGEKRTLRLQWAPSAAPRIRRELVEDLVARGVSAPVIDESEIVVSELVANAIRHARPLADGAIRVHWKVKNDVVEVEVSDGGAPTVPRPGAAHDVGAGWPWAAHRALARP